MIQLKICANIHQDVDQVIRSHAKVVEPPCANNVADHQKQEIHHHPGMLPNVEIAKKILDESDYLSTNRLIVITIYHKNKQIKQANRTNFNKLFYLLKNTLLKLFIKYYQINKDSMSTKSPVKAKAMKYTQSIQERSKSKTKPSQQSLEKNYFCHYNNAMYMGQIRAFKKNGKGLMLVDNGACVLTEYSHDVPIGHQLTFLNGSIISRIYNMNKTATVAFRCNKYILYLSLSAKNQLQGPGQLIDFSRGEVFTLMFKKNSLQSYQPHYLKNEASDIFQHKTYKEIIGQKHSNALLLKFPMTKGIQMKKQGNKIMIGFFSNNKLQGLGFQIFLHVSSSTSPEFDTYISQRGYYSNSILHGLGQKQFSNGNTYWGYFSKGQFEGHGFLEYHANKKWIRGNFSNGKLIDMIETVEDDDNGSKWYKALRNVHKNDSWIDYTANTDSQDFYYKWLDEILKTITFKNQGQQSKKDKQILLRKIQQNFFSSSRLYTDTILQVAQYQTEKRKSSQKNQNQSPELGKLKTSSPIEKSKITNKSMNSSKLSKKNSLIKVEDDSFEQSFTTPLKMEKKVSSKQKISQSTAAIDPQNRYHWRKSPTEKVDLKPYYYRSSYLKDNDQQALNYSPSFYRASNLILQKYNSKKNLASSKSPLKKTFNRNPEQSFHNSRAHRYKYLYQQQRDRNLGTFGRNSSLEKIGYFNYRRA